MKSTKLMLAVIATIISTWCVLGLIGWFVSELSFKDCLTHGGTLGVMLMMGWLPAVIIGYDLDKTIEE